MNALSSLRIELRELGRWDARRSQGPADEAIKVDARKERMVAQAVRANALLHVCLQQSANELAGVFDAVEAVSLVVSAPDARDELVHGVLSKGVAAGDQVVHHAAKGPPVRPRSFLAPAQPYASPRSISGAM